MTRTLRYDVSYEEQVTLADGTPVRLRLLRASDRDQLERGLGRLSARSQVLRFFTPKARFTEAELRYLTELDGWNHLAIGAVEIDSEGIEQDGIGVARFVRLPQEPTVAEPAVTVIDQRQGQGLGGMLVQRLMEAARERGIERFRSEFLAVNAPMRELFERMSDRAEFRQEGPVVIAEFPLGPPVEAPARRASSSARSEPRPIFEWLRLVAEKTVALRQRWLLPESLREALGRIGGGAHEEGEPPPDESTE